MRRIKRLPALLLLSLLLFGSVSCRPKGPDLVVTVRDGLTLRPVPEARCSVPGAQTRTDLGGQCTLRGWTSLDSLKVSRSGYQSHEVALAGLQPAGDPPQARVEVVLFPDQAQGTVLDAYAGKPVGKARVSAAGQTVLSDAAGQFILRNPAFPLALTVQAAGYSVWQGSFMTTTFRLSLRPNTLEGVVRGEKDAAPIAGATVTVWASVPLSRTTTDGNGYYRLTDLPETFSLRVKAPGYRQVEARPERTTRLDLRLPASVLDGRVVDGRDGTPLPKARVIWSGGWLHTDARGRFHLEGVADRERLQVLSPGFAKVVVTVTEETSLTLSLAPFAVQGIYVTGYVAGTPDWFPTLLDFVDRTELNAMVIEAKDAYGAITYDSQVPLVKELATSDPRFDPREVVRQCHERGIYVIAYIVTFEDSYLADARPEWALQNNWGGLWRNHAGLRWTDPYRREVWQYNVAIAKELLSLGFDEVQFDYIRFPTDGDTSIIVYSQETSIEKQYDAIAGFVEYAYNEIAPTGGFVSADIFGYAAYRKMWEQGQDLSRMGHFLDYVCPMAYPSHYSPGEQGCANPNACPYEIVHETVIQAYGQMTQTQRARVRAWLQDFDLGAPDYGPAEVAAQIKAAWDAGGWGWCLWNAGNEYTPGVDYSPQE